MEFNVGWGSPARVKVTNRQQFVEYTMVEGFATEIEVRAAIGNTHRETYSHYFSGYHHERKLAVERMEGRAKELRRELELLEFAIKVTKKKKWISTT